MNDKLTDIRERMNSVFGKKEQNTNNSIKNTVSNMLSSKTAKSLTPYNPFLNKDGSLFNKYINYQSVLDNPKVNSVAKKFISDATGLSPSSPSVIAQPVSAAPAAIAEPLNSGGNGATINNATINNAASNNIASAAQKYIGTPYVWGGESASEGGMDCSGFVYNALKDAGYDVGRTTAQGYRSMGNTVSKADMQPGDLIFYGKGGNASHIGIYVGNGKMIHSSGGSKNTKSNPGKGVSVANIDYRSDLLEARRY